MLVFDTLLYSEKLQKVGVSKEQAKVQAETLKEIIDDNLATKRDLEEVKTELKRDIEFLRIELKKDIETLRIEGKKDIEMLRVEGKKDLETTKSELALQIHKEVTAIIKWVAGLFIAQTGIIAALFKLLQ